MTQIPVPTQAIGTMRPDTRTILRVAGTVELVGLLCAATVLLTGGLNLHGPRSNFGWLALIIALGCIPTGTFFLILGTAKYRTDRTRTD